MPKKQVEENALVLSGGLGTVDLSTLPQADAKDLEGYDESHWKAFSYIQIRQKPLIDEGGKTILDPGQFRIYNEVLGDDIPDVPEIDIVILAIRGNARTRWEEEKVACRSIDGVDGTTTTEEPEHFKCAECQYREMPKNKGGCSTAPILVAASEQYGACVIKLTKSAIRPLGIFDAQRAMAAKQAKFSAPTLPPHFLQTRITTVFKDKPQPHFIPKFEVVAVLDVETIGVFRKQRESLLESFDFKPEVFEGDNKKEEFDFGANVPDTRAG